MTPQERQCLAAIKAAIAIKGVALTVRELMSSRQQSAA